MFGVAVLALACLAICLAIMAGAWYLCHVAIPRVEARLGGQRFAPEAEARARKLFLSKLDAGQRRAWTLRRRFTVCAPSGRRYRIGPYSAFNIAADGAVFCLAVTGFIPVYDKLLAQKLLIECDEAYFLASANVRCGARAWAATIAKAHEECRERGLTIHKAA